MNKKLQNFFTEQGMTVEGNRAYGIVKGYEVNAEFATYGAYGNESPLKVHFSFYATEEQKGKIYAAISGAGFKNCRHEFTAFGLVMGLRAMTVGKIAEMLPRVFEVVLPALADSGALGSEYCPTCGEPFGEDKKQCNINGYTVTLKESCVADINEAIEAENAAFKAAPNNYFRGFLGALVGALAGAAIAVVLFLLNFVSAISSVVAVFVGSLLYVKFGGKPTKMMLVIVSLTTVVMMALSVFLLYFVAAGPIVAEETGVAVVGMEAFKQLMQLDGWSGAFTRDMLMMLLFTAVGVVIQVVVTAQKIKRTKGIK